MSKLLALDTSSDFCSVTVYRDGKLTSEGQLAPRKHTQLLLPMVKSVLDAQSLELKEMDAIAFGCGPGSFTGLRIAAGVAQGLAYGIGCSVIAVSNLSALALQSYRQHGKSDVLVALDARMDEVYWAVCQLNENDSEVIVNSLVGEHVGAPESLYLPKSHLSKKFVGIGSGFTFEQRFPKSLSRLISFSDASARPHSDAICELALQDFARGVWCAPAKAAPVYLRDKIAWKKLPGRG